MTYDDVPPDSQADDPRWSWLERRLTEIHDDVKRINGTVRRHETEVALLRQWSHPQESCPIVHQAIKDIALLQQDAAVNSKMLKVALGVATLVGTLIVVIAQIVAQRLWH